MLSIVVNLALFIGAIIYLNKSGYDQPTIDLMLAGMVGSSLVGNAAGLIIAMISLNPAGMIVSLLFGLLHLWLFNIFVKRAGC